MIGSVICASAGNALAQVPMPPPAQGPAQAPPYPQQGPYQQPGYPQPMPYGDPSQPRYYPPPPPPKSTVAPNGEYVAPLSQTTQSTYVPQSVAMSGPRFIKDWEPGMPIPQGYHAETRFRKAPVIVGAAVFGGFYLYSSFFAAIGEDTRSNGEENPLGWLFVPVLGPFLQMMETDSATGKYVLFIDGMAQLTGAALMIGGMMYPKHLLVRNDLASMTVVPMKVGMEGSGFGVVGRF